MTHAEIEKVAADWVARRAGGSFQASDEGELQAWLDASTAHRIAYLRLVTAWKELGRLKALGAGAPEGTVPARSSWGEGVDLGSEAAGTPIERSSNRRYWRRGRPGTLSAIAASLAVALIVWRAMPPSPESYGTAVGAVSRVTLADGSHVSLDTNSQIRVNWSGSARRVELVRGDAYFEVSKDPSRPFIVNVNGARAVAVGTQFSVRRDEEGMDVLVTEGRVRLERGGEPATSESQLLPAGSAATVSPAVIRIEHVSAEDIERQLSWRQGFISLRDTPLPEAVQAFNRYTVRQIEIADPRLAAIRIGGNFRIDNVNAFLWLLQNGFPIQVEERPDHILLMKR
jgi:transmembrane sensor